MGEDKPMDPAQSRAARALLGWTQTDLAMRADVGVMTVKRFEAGNEIRSAQASVIRRALVEAGVILLADGSVCDGAIVSLGVALTK